MTGSEQISYIEKQMIAVHQERQSSVNCPYCDGQNIDGNPLCCEQFGRAAAAIMLRWDAKDRIAKAEQVAEKVSRN